MFKPQNMFKSPKVFFIFLLVGFQLVAQNKENRWVVGASVGVAKFSSEDSKFVGDQFIFQAPKLNASRYFFNGLTVDASLSFNTINKISGLFSNSIDYLSIDLGAKYDFGESNENLVPYIYGGTSFISANSEMTPTLNFGGGGTFWLNSRYGVNLQLLYKSAMTNTVNMRSHMYFSAGIIYSLKLRTLAPRLWSHNK